MDAIRSSFSNLFSHVSSINTQYLRPLLSFNSRNNTITTTDEEQASQQTTTNTDHSIIAMEVTQPESTAPSASSDGHEDQLKKTRKLALTIALSIAAISAGLVIHPLVPKSLHFLLTPYKFLLNGSLFIGVGLAIYSIKNNIGTSSTRSSNSGVQIVWVLRMSMRLGIITIFLAVVFRGLMIQY